MANNTGKTVAEILAGKRATIRRPGLDPGSPGWDDILDLTWEEVEERARRRWPGYQTIRKLLTDGRFDK